jgi:hypothetical protein
MNFDGASIFPVNDALKRSMAGTKLAFEERVMLVEVAEQYVRCARRQVLAN